MHVVSVKSAAASHDTRSPARLEALRARRMTPRDASGAFAYHARASAPVRPSLPTRPTRSRTRGSRNRERTNNDEKMPFDHESEKRVIESVDTVRRSRFPVKRSRFARGSFFWLRIATNEA
jgi:hypothetical protein